VVVFGWVIMHTLGLKSQTFGPLYRLEPSRVFRGCRERFPPDAKRVLPLSSSLRKASRAWENSVI
jgi:hypothetical protein